MPPRVLPAACLGRFLSVCHSEKAQSFPSGGKWGSDKQAGARSSRRSLSMGRMLHLLSRRQPCEALSPAGQQGQAFPRECQGCRATLTPLRGPFPPLAQSHCPAACGSGAYPHEPGRWLQPRSPESPTDTAFQEVNLPPAPSHGPANFCQRRSPKGNNHPLELHLRFTLYSEIDADIQEIMKTMPSTCTRLPPVVPSCMTKHKVRTRNL